MDRMVDGQRILWEEQASQLAHPLPWTVAATFTASAAAVAVSLALAGRGNAALVAAGLAALAPVLLMALGLLGRPLWLWVLGDRIQVGTQGGTELGPGPRPLAPTAYLAEVDSVERLPARASDLWKARFPLRRAGKGPRPAVVVRLKGGRRIVLGSNDTLGLVKAIEAARGTGRRRPAVREL